MSEVERRESGEKKRPLVRAVASVAFTGMNPLMVYHHEFFSVHTTMRATCSRAGPGGGEAIRWESKEICVARNKNRILEVVQNVDDKNDIKTVVIYCRISLIPLRSGRKITPAARKEEGERDCSITSYCGCLLSRRTQDKTFFLSGISQESREFFLAIYFYVP